MKINIIYDNEVKDERLEPAWGFSCLIELKNTNLLFDTGWDGNVLLSNMQVLKINPRKIEQVVLSHEHWDHIGGLTHILDINPKVVVYVPKSFGRKLKGEIANRVELVEISKHQRITDECISTGELGSRIKEQSLMIKTKKGLVVITGCAHPRLENILATAQKFGKIYAIIGGFHGFKEYNLLNKIPIIIPCHCTFHKREIANYYPKQYVECGAGSLIEI